MSKARPPAKSRKRVTTSPALQRTKLPTVTAQRALETQSRIIFDEAIFPWLVTPCTPHDYGIDAFVEVAKTRGNGDLDATSRRFAVQLKATAGLIPTDGRLAVRVKPTQVVYWIESTEPVLLVLCFPRSKAMFWRWIDDEVIDELTGRDPGWRSQVSVSVSIPSAQRWGDGTRDAIAAKVAARHRSTRHGFAPGRYLELHSLLTNLAEKLVASATQVGFESVEHRMRHLKESIRSSTYVVALAGPSRAGKSTLLNALLGRLVSPVGKLPTTAVSLLVSAGSRDEAEVVFEDRASIVGDPSPEFLAKFATQDQNPDNRLKVRLISVRLINALLERGVAYADAPGLHDPSGEIREVTEAALSTAHAVVYVLDVSPAKHGGFSLSSHHIADLNRLHGMADRVFIVLNKADVLDGDERDEVFRYVEGALKRYDVWESLPVPPMFLSASAAWSWRTGGGEGESPIAELDRNIWSHLLATNSTGVARLRIRTTELHRAGVDFAALLAARRADGVEAHRLQKALSACRSAEKRLANRCRDQLAVDRAFVVERLGRYRASLLSWFRSELERIPVAQSLPAADQLERMLQVQMMRALGAVWKELNIRFKMFAAQVSQEVEGSLSQVRMATGYAGSHAFQFPPMTPLKVSESFEEAWAGFFAASLFVAILGGPWSWVVAAGGWLAGLVLGSDSRRKRSVDKLMGRAAECIDVVLRGLSEQIDEKVRIYLKMLEAHVDDRISVFVHDVERQLAGRGKAVEPEEAALMASAEQTVRSTLEAVAEASKELEQEGT